MSNMKCRPVEKMTPQAKANFWAKVDKRPDGCWLWTGSRFVNGYGQFKGGPSTRAHRVAYELIIGPCPPNLEPNHICRVRHCVNPEHLNWVTHRDNLAYKDSWRRRTRRGRFIKTDDKGKDDKPE